jgi:hypothetical protein
MRTRRQAVLDGVVVNVVQVGLKVALVANRVFPEAALPHGTFTVTAPRGRWGTFADDVTIDASREAAFYQGDARGEIVIFGRKLHHQVQMVRQHYSGPDLKRVCGLYRTKSGPQSGNLAGSAQNGASVERYQRQKEPAAGCVQANVLAHGVKPSLGFEDSAQPTPLHTPHFTHAGLRRLSPAYTCYVVGHDTPRYLLAAARGPRSARWTAATTKASMDETVAFSASLRM